MKAAGRVLGRIQLRGIRTRGCHGVLPQERAAAQPFLLDLDLETDVGAAAETDRLDLTLDYAQAAALAAAVVEEGPHRDLLETLAGDIARRLLAAFPRLERGAVVVHKPEAPVGIPCSDVSVSVPFSRPRADAAS